MRLYACALVFGVYAVVRAAGLHSTFVSVVFLAVAAAAFVVAELERTRQRERLRGC